MTPVNFKAHYDGERILLDEPYDLPANVPLVVTILPPNQMDEVSARDLAIINANAGQLNQQAWDVFDYQGLS